MVAACDRELDQEEEELLADGEELDAAWGGARLLRRLDAGLFVLQLVDFLIGEVCRYHGAPARASLHKTMRFKNASLADIAGVLQGACCWLI